MASLATIQGWSEVPAIAHFCSLFRGALDLLEFEIEELEAALVGAAGAEEEELFSGSLLERLAVRLLRPCLPAALAQGVHEGNFSTYLRCPGGSSCPTLPLSTPVYLPGSVPLPVSWFLAVFYPIRGLHKW